MFTFQHPVALLATILLGGFFVLGQAHAENGAVVETITDLNLKYIYSDNISFNAGWEVKSILLNYKRSFDDVEIQKLQSIFNSVFEF